MFDATFSRYGKLNHVINDVEYLIQSLPRGRTGEVAASPLGQANEEYLQAVNRAIGIPFIYASILEVVHERIIEMLNIMPRSKDIWTALEEDFQDVS